MPTAPATAQAIQLALTPVFLLTAIGGILNVVTHRLGRVIDRARHLQGALPHEPDARAAAIRELGTLGRRMRLANRAVALNVAAALAACLLIADLFLSAATPFPFSPYLPALFVIALALLAAGLAAFLFEVRVAMRALVIFVPD